MDKSNIINNELIKDFRLKLGYTNLNNKIEIVPNNLKHQNLLREFNIDKSILKHYFLPTRNLLYSNEFEKLKKEGFTDKDLILNPYPICIYGAYHSRSSFVLKLSNILSSEVYYNENQIITLEDLDSYFQEYAKGFKKGFDEFEEIKIVSFMPIFADKQQYYIDKVFEYLTRKRLFVYHWGSTRGFCIDGMSKQNEVINAFEDGLEEGYFYKAWSIVLSNSNLFTPLFKNHYQIKVSQENSFSVLEWATIFYYVNETKLISEVRALKDRMDLFINTHNIETSSKSFKTKYYEAKKRINVNNDFPIHKLKQILPFLQENYNQTVTKVENDITFLEENYPDFQ